MTDCSTAVVFFFNDTATTEIYTLSLHDALPISGRSADRSPRICRRPRAAAGRGRGPAAGSHPPCGPRSRRSEEHTSELQSRQYLVCRLLLEKKHTINICPIPQYLISLRLPPALS